jgi:hypothetical protein
MTEPVVEVDEEVIPCLLSELDYAIRSEELAGGLFTPVEEVVELPESYAYRFAGADSPLESMLEFIAAERRCCPFLSFEIALAAWRIAVAADAWLAAGESVYRRGIHYPGRGSRSNGREPSPGMT